MIVSISSIDTHDNASLFSTVQQQNPVRVLAREITKQIKVDD